MVVIKQTTAFLLRLVFDLQISFQIANKNTKNKAIIKGNMQATNVFTIKIELRKISLLKSAKKQSNDMMVSVVCPKIAPTENVEVRAAGN